MKETDKAPCPRGTYTPQTISQPRKTLVSAKEKTSWQEVGTVGVGVWGIVARFRGGSQEVLAGKETLREDPKKGVSEPCNVGATVPAWDSGVRGL